MAISSTVVSKSFRDMQKRLIDAGMLEQRGNSYHITGYSDYDVDRTFVEH